MTLLLSKEITFFKYFLTLCHECGGAAGLKGGTWEWAGSYSSSCIQLWAAISVFLGALQFHYYLQVENGQQVVR